MPLKPCLDCRRLSQGSRCPEHAAAHEAARYRRRPSTTARGLGWDHQRQVRDLKRALGPLDACPRCGQPITPDNPITGEHGVPRAHGGTEVTELVCRRCNSKAGAGIRRRSPS